MVDDTVSGTTLCPDGTVRSTVRRLNQGAEFTPTQSPTENGKFSGAGTGKTKEKDPYFSQMVCGRFAAKPFRYKSIRYKPKSIRYKYKVDSLQV